LCQLVTDVSTLLLTIDMLMYYIPVFFFFNDPPPPEIYTLSLHDALPICSYRSAIRLHGAQDRHGPLDDRGDRRAVLRRLLQRSRDRKSTRLNSSHVAISYAVFCLKKKKDQSLQVKARALLCHMRDCICLR